MISRRTFVAALGLAVLAIASPLEAQEALAVSIDGHGQIWVGDRPVDEAGLAREARAYVQSHPTGSSAVLAADRRVVYATVVHVMDVLRGAGIEHFSIAVAPQGPAAPN